MTSQRPYRAGVVGLGNMGMRYLKVLHENPRYEVVWACDRNPERLAWAKELIPALTLGDDAAVLMQDIPVDVVGVFTLADVRPELMRMALDKGAHVIAEKPIAADITEEQELLRIIEASDRLVTVNLFNRNTWYHHFIRDFIQEGQIGQLAVLNIQHQTPGLLPGEGHTPEGPPFHDCGMHYVDLARWYAQSEFDRWDAQGLRMWGHEEPWWVTAHGSFENGIVFTVTQGFTYGQLAQTQTIHSGLEAIGTLGVVRMQHDFNEVVIECHGVSRTERKVGPYTGKNLDKLCQIFAESLDTGKNLGLPTPRDSVTASAVSQAMLDFARTHAAPRRGTADELKAILEHREALRRQNKDLVTNAAKRSR